jgi:hypothetical protein
VEASKQLEKLARGTKIAGLVFLSLAIAIGIVYLAMGSVFHLQGQEINLPSFIVSGVLFVLVGIFSLVLDLPSKKRMIFFSFFLSALLGVTLAIAIPLFLLQIPHETDLSARLVSLFLPLSILPVILSVVLSALLLFKKEIPLWALLVAYVLEAVLLTIALYFSFSLLSKILYILIFGLVFLRSSQYMLLLLEEGNGSLS